MKGLYGLVGGEKGLSGLKSCYRAELSHCRGVGVPAAGRILPQLNGVPSTELAV